MNTTPAQSFPQLSSKPPINIWLITQYYPPEVGAPSTRLSGLAKSWQDLGANVTVLTGIPNHPDGIIPEAYRGRPAFEVEVQNGIPVHRHWLYVAPNRGKIKRVVNMVSFAASVLLHNLRRRTATRPDVIIASSPSFFCVVSAWLLARRHGAKFVFEVRDLWPAIFVQMGILRPGFIYKVLEGLEGFLYRRADAIVTVTRSFAKVIIARGNPAHKLSVVFNGVSDTDYAAATAPQANGATTRLRATLGLSPLTKIVLYIGNHGEAQGLTQIIDAARLLVKRTDTVFLFVGHGADKPKLQDYAKGVPNVQFLPGVSHQQVWDYYGMADINLVCLKNIPDFDMFIPSKMFEIMAAGTCAVAGLRGEGAEIMRESKSAVVVGSEEPDAMADAIASLLDDPTRRAAMGQAGRTFVAQYFLHSQLAAHYLKTLLALRG
jgi:glycosyltransferase involved in cell wall biosynthesis